MSDGQVSKTEAGSEGAAKWPGGEEGAAVAPPVSQALLANAAARAAASGARRELMEYLRLRRKT
jgi:hypothetical protein